jgi:hypothetical protein
MVKAWAYRRRRGCRVGEWLHDAAQSISSPLASASRPSALADVPAPMHIVTRYEAEHHARLSSPPPMDDAEEERERVTNARGRQLDAKRKRIRMLNELLRELDTAVYLQLITVYHLDCSFFWLALKAFTHAWLLTPLPDTAAGDGPPDAPKPFLLLLLAFAVNFLLHLTYPAPSAGEDTRGYLHGGLMIDFIGQQGPTSTWTLGALDTCLLALQLVMVSVHVKRRELKKKLATLSAGGGGATATTANAALDQDADDEERGQLHRTDTLSDIGAAPVDEDEDDALLPAASEPGHADALDMLTSGQCVIGEFSALDTLLHENRDYSAYRLTRSESSGMNDMPETLRRFNTLRTRFGVGGG